MIHLGDITKIDGISVEPVWCVTGGSLFDGIGGFPLCWEDVHGAGRPSEQAKSKNFRWP